MSNNAVVSRWQRFLGWINRQRRIAGESVSAGASRAIDGRKQPKAEQVDAWEDEGGAPAVRDAGGSAVPTPPANPTR